MIKGRYIALVLLTPVVITAIYTFFLFYQLGFFRRCEYYVFSTVDIVGTNFKADIWSIRCGSFAYNGGWKIDIVDKQTNVSTTVVNGIDVEEARLTSPHPGELLIAFPNRNVSEFYNPRIPGITVSYNFTPTDDPDDRKRYRQYQSDPRNEANRYWYCNTYVPSVYHQKLTDMTNEALAYGVWGADRDAAHRLYCP